MVERNAREMTAPFGLKHSLQGARPHHSKDLMMELQRLSESAN